MQRRLTTTFLILLVLLPITLFAQRGAVSIYPQVLYSGMNVITISSPVGIAKVLLLQDGQWKPLLTGYRTRDMQVVSGASFGYCANQANFKVYVKTLSRPVRLLLRIEDCRGGTVPYTLQLSEQWVMYREDFGLMEVGETRCREFTVTTQGNDFIVDSVGSRSPYFKIQYTGPHPPVRIPRDGTYHYNVCFTASRPGAIKFPIDVYLRREQPAGGYTNFIVADTAYATVLKPEVIATRPPSRPRRPVVRTPEPEPKPKAIPDVDSVSIVQVPPVVVTPSPAASTGPSLAEEPQTPPTPPNDPTTFRVILGPTARPVEEGKLYVANYDVGGVIAGAGVTDRLTVSVGGLYVPPSIDYIAVATIGGRYEFYREGYLRMAGGLQLGYSNSDVSTIMLTAPYSVVSLGDDDARANITLGYSWRRHQQVDGVNFTRQAVLFGGGGDYRLADHWKIAAEAYFLENSEAQPLVMTGRYFTDKFAVDAGLGIDLSALGNSSRTWNVAPVISIVWVW